MRDREEGKDLGAIDRWRRVVREGAKWENSKETRSINEAARTNLFSSRVTRLPSSPQFVRKATRHRATDKAEFSGTNDFALARWQNIGLGRVGAFVEERFSRRRIRMVNGFADWVVW